MPLARSYLGTRDKIMIPLLKIISIYFTVRNSSKVMVPLFNNNTCQHDSYLWITKTFIRQQSLSSQNKISFPKIIFLVTTKIIIDCLPGSNVLKTSSDYFLWWDQNAIPQICLFCKETPYCHERIFKTQIRDTNNCTKDLVNFCDENPCYHE